MIVDIPVGFAIPRGCVQMNPDRPREFECNVVPRGWQCTSPEGYDAARKELEDNYKELKKLRRRCGN